MEKDISYLFQKYDEVSEKYQELNDWRLVHGVEAEQDSDLVSELKKTLYGKEGIVIQIDRVKTLKEANTKLFSIIKWIIGVLLACGTLIVGFLVWLSKVSP